MKVGCRLRKLSAWSLVGVLEITACVGQVVTSKQPAAGGGGSSPSGSNGTVPGVPGGTGTTAGSAPATGNGNGVTAAGSGTSPGGTGTGTGTATSSSAGSRDPGRVTMRQLNHVEYDNTVRDLLGTAQQPGLLFLNDSPAFAFDNNADQLSVSPVQAQLYQQAAESLAAEAITAPFRARLITCDLAAAGDTCSRTIIASFGAKAYRRPLTDAEITSYLALVTAARGAGATADEVARTMVEAFLVSPSFLHRIEFDPDPVSLVPHRVAPYEMAARLSYLVYRSMPDQALFDAAAAGKLASAADVQTQLTRMLADPKGSTFAQDFSVQWIGARSLESIQFDPTVFPRFSPALAASMKSELTSFFDDFIRENLPVDQLLTARFSYLDDALAVHYGVPAVGAGGLKRTVLGAAQRGGLLTMAGTLAVTSYMTRTSLVKRGAWIMAQLLCQEPPPPPNDVPAFPSGPLQGTQRQILQMHRANPSCAVCHITMDNLGLALENYDGIGAWRTVDESGGVIDANGSLGSVTFNGGQELAAVLAADPRFAPCVSRKMLGYALGRTLASTDEPYVGDIAAGTSAGLPGVRDMLDRVVASDTFNLRHGEP